MARQQILSFMLLLTLWAGPVVAQEGFHQPLDQRTPPGQAAAWLNHIRHYDPTWLQPVRVDLPSSGDVAIYTASPEPVAITAAPATFAVNVGHLYRLQVTNLPEFPGVELYPTVEILDRMHPPLGREDDFPIPVPIEVEDVQLALTGRLVTRVIYLEQPQTAQGLDPLTREIPQTVQPTDNSLEEADRLGRPMLILRLGGRRPAGPSTPASFYGTGGVVEPRLTPEPPGVVRHQLTPAAGTTIIPPSLVRR